MDDTRKPKQAALKFTVKERGIGWLEWKEPEYSVNKLSLKVLREWEQLLPKLEKTSLKVLVLISRKERSFIAGADLRELRDMKSKEELASLLDRSGKIFCRFEALKAIKIAAVHGACLGGGLELALICDYRLVTDSPQTRFGFPEVKLGLIPGLGGTFLLPRKVGLKTGLNMILSGHIIPSEKALQLGIVEETVPKVLLEKRAQELARQEVEDEKLPQPSRKKNRQAGKKTLMESFLFRSLIFYQAREFC